MVHELLIDQLLREFEELAAENQPLQLAPTWLQLVQDDPPLSQGLLKRMRRVECTDVSNDGLPFLVPVSLRPRRPVS